MNTAPITERAILQALSQVVDPELDCNIVDLGLVYGLAIEGAKVKVSMTLTTPGCPMQESLAWGVQNALLNLEGMREVEVEVVWDPPWHPSMMTNAGRARTGVGGY